MNNSIYSSYQTKYNSTLSYKPNLNPQTNQIPYNYEYFQRMMPHMNRKIMENSIDDMKMFPTSRYYYGEQGIIIAQKDFYSDRKILENNKNQNESPVKSNHGNSKTFQKGNNNHEKIPVKDNYINLLINSIDELFKRGEITMEYLNAKNHLKFDPQQLGLTLNSISEESNNTFSKKCDNKVCTFLADHPHKLFQAKFFASTSYKPKNLWLCEKCYKAYSSGNYCYYCHTVYREYIHGTQYYDRKKWIQCDYCQKWIHMLCEEKKGKYENIEELSLNANFKYMCPFCRKDHESIMRQKHKNEKLKKINMLNIKKKRPLNEGKEFNKINKK